MIGNGQPVSGFGAIPVLRIEDDKAVQGIAFSVRQRYAILGSGVLNLVLDPTAFTGKEIVFQPPLVDALGGPIEIDIYANVAANSDGTLVPVFNRSFKSSNVVQSIVMEDPTGISTAGSPAPIELLVPSDGVPAVSAGGASGGGAIITLLDPALKYLLRLTNKDSATASIGIKLDFFEVV